MLYAMLATDVLDGVKVRASLREHYVAFLQVDPLVMNGLYLDVIIRPWLWMPGDGKPLEN